MNRQVPARGQLEPPRYDRSPIVERHVVLDDADITFVAGPAGAGKTTLLAQWYDELRRQDRRPAWLAVDVGASDLSYAKGIVVSSLSHRHPHVADLDGDDALAEVPSRDRVIFIDDLHHLDQRVVDELLLWFGRATGQPWRLVLAGRTAMDLSAHGAADRSIRLVGPQELKLDGDEVREALGSWAGDLSDRQQAVLAERLGGWAAGAGLARQELADRPPNARTKQVLDGSHPAVADYFEREVLSGLPLSDQDFLVSSSVLTEPSIEACDQVAGDSRSAERLARLGNLHAFLHPSTDGIGYEWVPFAREFLLQRLRLVGDEAELEARSRLLRWCLSQGNYDEAVSQAVEISDWYAIVDLALDAGLDVIGCGRAEDLVRWLEQLPPDVVSAESGVAVVAAMALWVSRGDEAGDEIDAWLAPATRARRGSPPCQAESLSGAIDASRGLFSRLDPRTRKLLAQRALHHERGSATAWGALSHAAVGLAAYVDDQPREARSALTESLRIQASLDVGPRRWVSRLFSPYVLGVLALIDIELGGYDHRAEALLSAAELQSHGTAVPGSEIVRLAQGRAALARGDRQVALELFLQTAREARLTAFKALGYLDAASIYCEQGRVEESAACLVAADRLLDRAPDGGRLLSRRRRAIERQVRLGRAAHRGTTEALTEREIEVLRLLESDLSRREIARELYLSFETVKTYVKRLYRKLGVSSRSAAVATAYAWGLLDEAGPDDRDARDDTADDGETRSGPAYSTSTTQR